MKQDILQMLCVLALFGMISGTSMAVDTTDAYPGSPTYAYPTTPGVAPAYGYDGTTFPGTGIVTDYSMGAPSSIGPSSAGLPSTVGAYPSTAPMAVYQSYAPPAGEQRTVLSFSAQTPPTAVYYSGTFLPWTTFSTRFAASSPMLWANTNVGWAWYTACPLGGWVQELMFVPRTGTMKLYELYPDGTTKMYNYGWASAGYKYIWFYADSQGRHITIFTISDTPSNWIAIDVF